MGITLTISADGPAQIASIWDQLRPNTIIVDINDDEMFIDVDLTEPAAVEEVQPDEPVAPPTEAATYVPPVDKELQAILASNLRAVADLEPATQEEPAGDRIVDRVLAVLDSAPDEIFDRAAVADTLDDYIDPSLISTTLSTLFRDGKVRRPERGRYHSLNRTTTKATWPSTATASTSHATGRRSP